VQVKATYIAVAFIGYELLAYFINRSIWQRAVTTGDYSGQMPFDLLGQMLGYGATPSTGSVTPALALPNPAAAQPPPLPQFTPAPIAAPTVPDILSPDAGTPPFVTWPSGA
jgi:hypothetical protein